MPICTCVHQSRCESMRFTRDFTKLCMLMDGLGNLKQTLHSLWSNMPYYWCMHLNSGKPNTSTSIFGSEGCEFNIELALHTKHHQETNLVLLMRSILN